MKAMRLLIIGAGIALAGLAMACGGGDSVPLEEGAGGGAAGILPAAGEQLPPQHVTFEGDRYELVTLVFDDAMAEDLEVVGELSQSSNGVGEDRRVFRGAGDPEVIYTFGAATIEDPAH